MDSFVDMVIKGVSVGTIIEGSGGTGKSYRVINKASRANLDFAYLDSFTTPQGLYIWLYKNRDKELVILDDVVGLTSDKSLSFLKGALWAIEGKERIIQNNSSKPIRDEEGEIIPNVAQINARFVIITNYLKPNPHVNAVLSRVNYCRVDIPRDEILRIMEQVAKKEYEGLKESERMEVFNFLKSNTDESCSNLNIRTLIKAFQFKQFANQKGNQDLWKKLLLKVLDQDMNLLIVQQIAEDESLKTEDEKVTEFSRVTQKSRATYFRLKKRLNLKSQEKGE